MLRILALILAVAFIGAAWAQPPRCWQNADGVTECGTRPPPDVAAREIRLQRIPTTAPAEEAARFAEADVDAEEQQRLALQRSACNLARETLAAYERSEFLYERDPQGNRRVLEDDEATRVKEETRQEVATRCAGLDDSP